MSKENEEISFKDQMAAERKYYLGHTDTIPGTTTLIADARKEHQERQAADDKAAEERRIVYLKSDEAPKNVAHTTVVTPGVLVDVMPKSQIEVSEEEIEKIENPDSANPTAPSRNQLKQLGKEELHSRAMMMRDVGPVENTSVEKLIDVILDETGGMDV